MYIKHLNFNKEYKYIKTKYNITKNTKTQKKKNINIYSLLKYKSLLNFKQWSIKKVKKNLKFLYLIKKKKFNQKFFFKSLKYKIYAKNKQKKKLNKVNLIIKFQQSKTKFFGNKKVINIFFYKNSIKFKKWRSIILNHNKKKNSILLYILRKKKYHYWTNILFLTNNNYVFKCLHFKNIKDRKKFLWNFYSQKLKYSDINFFFYNKFMSKKIRKFFSATIINNNINLNKKSNFSKNFFFFFKKFFFWKKIIKFYKTFLTNRQYITLELKKMKKQKKKSKKYFKFIKHVKLIQNSFKNGSKVKNLKKNLKTNVLLYNKFKYLNKLKQNNFNLKKKHFKFKVKKQKKTIKFKKKYVKFKKNELIFWFFFKKKNKFKSKLKLFFKKYLIFFKFHKDLIPTKNKKKIKKNLIKEKTFKKFFWSIESKINIFLVRIGFLKNLIQSNFLIKKKHIFLNNKLVYNIGTKIKKNDFLQISYCMHFFLKKKQKKTKSFFFFLIQKLLKRKKNPFYLELNNYIQTCFLLYKPEPKEKNIIRIQKFNFFFYKYLFFFLKKKTF